MKWLRSRTAVVVLVAAMAALTVVLGSWQGWLAQAQGDTFIVNNDKLPAVGGCDTPDFETTDIENAVVSGLVSDDDTLVVCEGTYVGDVAVSKSLTIEGRAEANRADIVVQGGGGANGFAVTADDVTIRHLKFDGVDNSGIGVYVTGDGATVQDVEAVTWVNGAWVDGSDGSLVEDCDVDDNAVGIGVLNGQNNEVRSNVAGDGNAVGVFVGAEDLDLVKDNDLSGSAEGLALAPGAGKKIDVQVLRNTIHAGAGSDGILVDTIDSADSLIIIGGRAEDANSFAGSPNPGAGEYFLEMACGGGPPDNEVTVNATWNYWGGINVRSAIAALIYDDEDDNECGTPHGAAVFHPWATAPAPTPSPSPTPTPTPTVTPTPSPTVTPSATRTFDLVMGWNNFVWTGSDGTAAETALQCISGKFAVAYEYDGTSWKRYVPGEPDISTLATVDKYDSLLVLITASGVQCTMTVVSGS
jgi:parallel beta-helix repeat protein